MKFGFAGRLGVVACLSFGVVGCGASEGGAEPDSLDQLSEPIVGGGNLVSVSTRRAKGLVDVQGFTCDTCFCSGALLSPNAVLTAAHCLRWWDIGSRVVRAPRTDGTYDVRTPYAASQVGATDMAVMLLLPATAGMQWPQISNPIATAPQSNYPGKQVSMFGQGYSSYVAGGGVTGLGIWKTYRPLVDSVLASFASGEQFTTAFEGFFGDAYKLVSMFNPNFEGPAGGDSGAPVFDEANNSIMAVETNIDCLDWKGKGTAGDPGCSDSTVLAVGSAYARPTYPFSSFISEIVNRPTVYTFQPLSLTNNWSGAPYGTHWATASGTQPGAVALRGAIRGGTTAAAIKLPSAFRPVGGVVYLPVVTSNSTIGRLLIHTEGTTNVQSEGQTVADGNATDFTSLDGVGFDPTSAGYTPLTPAAGWTGAPFQTRAPAVKVLDGVVSFQGGMTTTGNSHVLFTLPAEARPATNVWVPVGLCSGHKGRLSIVPNGTVTVDSEGDWATSRCLVSLDGASFLKPGGAPVSVVTLGGSWTSQAFGGSRAGIRDDFGIIRFQGSLQGGASGYLFTLPQSMRPSVNVYLYADAFAAARARILIKPNGDVVVNQGLAAAESFLSLDGLWFGI